MAGGLGRLSKHEEYYFSDGSVSFLTGKTLFRVHKTFFERESDVFRSHFASAAEEDPQSGTDAQPFILDVTSDEFAELLWVWYDREYSYQQQTKERWITVLRLSSRWQFDKIKALAIRELDALNLLPAERIKIYNEHGVDSEQLMSSYIDICKSPTLPTEADGHLMQMETLIKLLQARENAQRKAVELGHESPTSASLEDGTLREIISNFFKGDLNPRPDGLSTGSGDQADPSGEHNRRIQAIKSTITVGEPQIPDRRGQSAGGPSHPNSTQTGTGGKGNQDKGKRKGEGEQVGNKDAHEYAKENDETAATRAQQDKEREEREKLRLAEEEKAKLAKEREQREKLRLAEEEKAKLAKEREEREKLRLAEEEKAKLEKAKLEAEAARQRKQNSQSTRWGNRVCPTPVRSPP